MRRFKQGQQGIYISEQTMFVLYVLGSFLLLSTILVSIDFVPELRTSNTELAITSSPEVVLSSSTTEPAVTESLVPTSIAIERIGLDTPIVTPKSTDIDVLDRALLSGAVHYPDSGLLGQNANMLLFGHSSYLPVIHNKAFKAFNELDKLKKGDLITVYSDTHMYQYETETVTLSKAGNVQVQFEAESPMLTLSTCNNFGSKQDRWIVTAKYLSKEQR
jgi:sortase A